MGSPLYTNIHLFFLSAFQLIPAFCGKLTGLSIYPNYEHSELGHTLAAITDQSIVSLIDFHMGVLLTQYQLQKVSVLLRKSIYITTNRHTIYII